MPRASRREAGSGEIGIGDFWKYRVGDYRIVAHIEDQLVRILVIRIGNLREVYR